MTEPLQAQGTRHWPQLPLPADRLQRAVFARIEISDGCWLWRGAKNSKGYGSFNWRPGNQGEYVHRLIYGWLIGPIPLGLCVLHRCDNPPCANPGHLFLGTQKDNAQDMLKKGRGRHGCAYGERAGAAKLTWEQVGLFRELYALGLNRAELARRFNIGWTTANHIVRGDSWRIATLPSTTR